jgi:hypothetical protein
MNRHQPEPIEFVAFSGRSGLANDPRHETNHKGLCVNVVREAF